MTIAFCVFKNTLEGNGARFSLPTYLSLRNHEIGQDDTTSGMMNGKPVVDVGWCVGTFVRLCRGMLREMSTAGSPSEEGDTWLLLCSRMHGQGSDSIVVLSGRSWGWRVLNINHRIYAGWTFRWSALSGDIRRVSPTFFLIAICSSAFHLVQDASFRSFDAVRYRDARVSKTQLLECQCAT